MICFGQLPDVFWIYYIGTWLEHSEVGNKKRVLGESGTTRNYPRPFPVPRSSKNVELLSCRCLVKSDRPKLIGLTPYGLWRLLALPKPHKDKYQNHIVDDLTRPRPRPGELINV